MTTTGLKPFHESVVDVINHADAEGFDTLAQLIKETKIPKGHDAIAIAWTERCEELRINIDYKVAESVMAQKKDVEAEAAEKGEAATA